MFDLFLIVTVGDFSFIFVGVNYFGFFYIKYGRSMEKRYRVFFICLIVRVV